MTKRILLFAMSAISAMAQSVVAGHVTLSVEEYNRLLELASKPQKRPDAPPASYAIQTAAMKLRVENESVTGTIDLRGEVLEKYATKAKLVAGMTVFDARQNGRALPIVREGGTHVAVLAPASDFAITLHVGMPLAIEPGRASYTLTAPDAGTVQMQLTVPGEQTVVNISPGLITERTSSGGKTTVHATLVPGKPATVWWASRLGVQTPAVPKEVRFLSDVKTLMTVSESDVAMQSLANVTVVQGDPEQFVLELPAGYEVTGATAPTLRSSDASGGRLILRVNDPHVRAHQFLISLTKSASGGKAELALPGFAGSQRETGEVLVEGIGTMELSAAEHGGLRRMDVKEGSAQLRASAKNPVYAAFRYQKRAETPGVDLAWVRFPDTPVVPAVAERAVVTTLVTSEGRSLTEVRLTIKNREQAFVKVALPKGAQILSAEVAGEKVKPVTAADSERVPLLRPGFRPLGPYQVSFVFLHEGTPFAKKGAGDLTLPKMDVPVGLVTWEVFLPRQYRVAEFGGDAIPARVMPAAYHESETGGAVSQDLGSFAPKLLSLAAGQIGGYVVDQSDAIVPNVTVTVTLPNGGTRTARSDTSGRWLLLGVPSGHLKIRADAPGFKSFVREADYDSSQPGHFAFRLEVGNVSETVTVMSNNASINRESQQIERNMRQNGAMPEAASVNVTALQNRVVGVLPIAVNVPKAGNSYRFVRPLLVDEETRVTFRYREGK